MPLACRRGVSLIELMIALTMFGVVAAVLFRMLAANQQLYQSQTQRIDRRQNIRAAEVILPTELRELDAADGDILALSSTSITLRAMRQLGFVCAQPQPGETRLLIRERPIFGQRDFDPATDSLLVYAAGDSAMPDDGRWMTYPLVSIGSGACDDGAPARLLETGLQPRSEVGAPVRGFEIVTYRLYRASDGEWQIGLAAGPSGGIQPLIGPVTSNGLELNYRDSAGGAVTEPARVAAIEIRLRAPTAQLVRGADGTLARSVDSTVVVVALRNNRRP